MQQRRYLFTSESVTEGHPDKIADQISDGILDAYLQQDPASRVACECLVNTGLVLVAGEITSNGQVACSELARRIIQDIGYTDSAMGFDGATCAVLTSLDAQSADISQGVTAGEGLHKEQGAGDQGLMFGYACNETPELMPLPIRLAHRLTQRLAQMRTSGQLPFLRPDGKAQVSVEYEDHQPQRVTAVVVSAQHTEDISYESLQQQLVEHVVQPVIPAAFMDADTRFFINPTGRFVTGGPLGDCGLTGRKIIVDTYGGQGSHGGGAFSGKDPSKVDRSASYMARHIAKNIVAAQLAQRCEVQLAYAIGVAQPVSVMVDTFGTGCVSDTRLEALVREQFDLRPAAIIDYLQLLRPIYRQSCIYGHFGRERPEFTWESTQPAQELVRRA